MFLSKSDEEITPNRKLAKELVDKWSRPIFNKSTRFDDMRNHEDETGSQYRRPSKEKLIAAIDPVLDVKQESTLDSIYTVAEPAGHCTAREPGQRPDMSHVVCKVPAPSFM